MNTISCVFCNEKIKVEGEIQIAQRIECTHCHKSMEVVWLFPLELVPSDGSDIEKKKLKTAGD